MLNKYLLFKEINDMGEGNECSHWLLVRVLNGMVFGGWATTTVQ